MLLKPDDIIYDSEWNEYKIIEVIGRGGMGIVLSITRVSDGKKFALKALSLFIKDDNDYRALTNEGILAQSIEHKNVIKYHYFHDGTKYPNLDPYIIMDLADKKNLQDLINEKLVSNLLLEQWELVNIFSQIIDWMEAINKVLIHRDIKPGNILISNNEIKISDFGISKVIGDPTRSKSFKWSGTLPFFPPECFSSSKNTIQMDIYSMGIVFYILATLKHPYETNKKLTSEEEWRNAHLYSTAPLGVDFNKTISPKIFSIIQKMIEKDPEKRFSQWNDIREEISGLSKISELKYWTIIEKIASKNLLENTKKMDEELARKKKMDEEIEKIKILVFQFSNDIIKPLREFIEEYNKVNTISDDQILIRDCWTKFAPRQEAAFEIRANNLKFRIEIGVHMLSDVDSEYSGQRWASKDRPEIDNRKIIAWGCIEENMWSWFNILLVEKKENLYWEWYLLENRYSGLYRGDRNRPEPFPFRLNELPKEIHLIKAMHIYSSKLTSFDPIKIIDFISNNF